MFKRTKTRLALLNSIVLVFILNGFGVGLYHYMEYRLYAWVDGELLNAKMHLQEEHLEVVLREKDAEQEVGSRIAYLLWDDQGKLTREIPNRAFYATSIPQLTPVSDQQNVRMVVVNKRTYRVLEIPIQQFQGMKNSHLKICQIIYDMQSEQNILQHLLLVIEVGAIISIIVAVLAGFYLANQALVPIQQAWEKQQRFVADASHELRTPLAVIRIHLERLFRHPDHTIEAESEHISEVIRETNRISHMVADLLTLARSGSGELQMNMQSISFDEVLRRVTQQFQDLAETKGIRIITKIHSPLQMRGDQERLHQLMVILLDNAWKYTKEAGTITVIAEKVATQIHVEVSDTGIGIAPTDLPHIFDRFYRGNKARTRTQIGSGLGLSIAKWIVEEHGGKIRVTSELGVGTYVKVTLPKGK